MKRALLLLLLCACQAKAATELPVTLETGARAKVSVGCCFDSLPSSGYAPLEVTINNFSGAPQRWTFEFSSPAYSPGNGTSLFFSATVTVENNATRTVPLLVPLSPTLREFPGGQPLRVTAKGYGINGSFEQQVNGGPNSGHPPTRFVVISNSLGTAMWSKLTAQLGSSPKSMHQLSGSLVEPAALPEDWRGLSGVAAMWLAGSEVDQLSPAQRGALRNWVRMGGSLTLCGATSIPPDFQPAGFGDVKTLPGMPDVNATAAAIVDLGSPRQWLALAASKAEQESFGAVKPNVPGLICFMLLFAVVVGPVNVFALAGESRRQRLFWTTPLISVAASAILVGFILLQDGVGGRGVRSALVYVVPREHSEIVLQEQTSRTGLLLGSAFHTRDAVFIDEPPAETQTGNRRKRSLENEDTSFRGEWFASRSVQTQRIETVLPTRGEITVLDAGDAPPVILSSFAATLDTLVYTDTRNRRWCGTDIRTGRKKELAPGGMGGRNLRVYNDPGAFVATARDSTAFVDTLQSIRWQDEPVTYFGPVTIP